MADTWKTGCYWVAQYVTLGCLVCHVTAMSQLPHYVNKFPIAYDGLISSNISSACAKEYLITAMY